MKTSFATPLSHRLLIAFTLAVLILKSAWLQAQPLTAVIDPVCTTQCCDPTQPCACSAGVIAVGGVPPYSYLVFGSSGIIGNTSCVTGLCPGTYNFEVRDANGNTFMLPVTVGGICCQLNCSDTTICFDLPDSAVVLTPPSFSPVSGGSIGGDCISDSIWNNAPGVYPVGTTVVTWYVSHNGLTDSCTQNVTRNPPSSYTISFTTSPPIVAGVINICNGQSITFNDNSTGITGLLWNFGNGYYSSNSTHTEPASHYPPGTYYDTLTVYDACGTPHDTAFMVVVDSASGPDIYCISVVCPGDTVTYHTNANCSTYTWTVTGGTFLSPPTSTSDSVTIIWGAGPQGTISLSVNNCSPPLTCPFPTIKTIHIVPATLPIAGDTVICAGATTTHCVECIPGNNHSWELMPANAGIVSGQNTCCVTIQWNPNFFGYATLTVNYQNVLTGSGCNLPDNCTNDPGCGGTGIINIHVKPIFGIAGPSTVCANAVSLPFNGMNTTNNTVEPATSWKVVTPIPSALTFANTALFNAYTWNAGPGTYQVTAYAPSNIYCNDSATVNVTVIDLPVPNAIVGPDTVCAGDSITYSVIPNATGVIYNWSVSGGTVAGPANGSSVVIVWNPGGGSVTVSQQLAAAPFCTSQSTVPYAVVTWPNFTLPVITAGTPVACVKSTVTYSIPPALISNGTYTWSVEPSTAGNIVSANGTDSIVINWVDASITPVYVKLKIERCYVDSVMHLVNLLPLPPVPNISYTPANPCVNDAVSFTTTSAGPTWNWNFGDTGTSALQNPTHIYTSGGDFNVQLYVTNTNGCSDTSYIKVHVDDIPVVPAITGDSSVCLNNMITYSFSEPLFMGAAYTWSLSSAPKGSITASGNNFATVLWLTPGIDTVKVHVQSQCLDTVIKHVIHIYALPSAGISLPSLACEGAPLTFTGSGGSNYLWNFSGGLPSTSSLQSPVITYAVYGTYPVSLSIVDTNGCTANATTSITVNPLPLALITGPSRACSFPATVTYSAVSAAGYSFAWTPSGNTPSITTTINAQTTFSVVVTNAFGCTKLSNAITIDTIPCPVDSGACIANDSIDFTYTPAICLTETYIHTGPAPLTGWTFGDGGSDTAVSPVSHAYSIPGIYYVVVSGVGNGFDINTGVPCITNVTKGKFVTVPFDAKYEYSFQCNGLNQMQVVFSNTSLFLNNASLYNWTWYDSTTSTLLSNNAFPPPVILSAGSHTVALAIFDPVTLSTCTIAHTFIVPTAAVASFTVPTPICQGTAATFTSTSTGSISSIFFDNNNGSTATTSPASLTYVNSGPFTPSLTVTDIYGCTSVATQNVNVTPAGTGTLIVGSATCDSVMLTASGPGPYTWSVINPPPFPSNPVWVKTNGYYSVIGAHPSGCPYKAGPVQVIVNQSPDATISGDQNYCQGEQLDLKTYTAGTSFSWNIYPSGPVLATTPNLNIVAASAGTFIYQVTITAANGCTDSDTITVIVDPVPSSAVITASGPLTFCNGDSVLLTVNPPGSSYLWSKSPAPALASPEDTNDSLYVKAGGTYSVIVQTANGCAYPAIAPVTITVNPNPVASISGDTVLCEGDVLQLQSTPVAGGSYSWTGPVATGNTNPFIVSPVQLSDAGIYIVTVTNSFGCSATDAVNVVVNPAPAPPFITSNPGGVLCEGQLYILSVQSPSGPPIIYTWNTAQVGVSIAAARPGNYYVTATNQFGCSAASNVLTIHAKPDLSCVPAGCYDFCSDCDSVTIPGPAGLFSYQWEYFNGASFIYYSSTQNITVYPPGGVYRLLGSNQWGCADSTDSLKIDFHDCCPPIDTTLCADTCINFDNQNLSGWQPRPSAPNVGITITNSGSQGGPGDYYIQANDQPGPSQLMAGNQFYGAWCCGEFCFDYKMIDDGVAGIINVNPQFAIFRDTFAFSFTSSVIANETNGWHTICAPVNDCDSPSVTPAGTWTPLGSTTVADWQYVLNYITEVIFRVDYTVSASEASGFDNACINEEMPHVDAGADTSVCKGSVFTLTAQGCTGNVEWYSIQGDSLIIIGNGPIVDIFPSQNTCYVAKCCSSGGCCCASDTVCVSVLPLPTLIWPVTYPEVCVNSDSIYLDTANIFVIINSDTIPVNDAGGTGVFSGPGVSGNYFFPINTGTYNIIYSYTDNNGCTGTVTNSITVKFCCDTCTLDAGADQSICAGQTAILTVQGCTGIPTWKMMTQEGPVPIGQGITVDVFPTQNTCYVVTCCDSICCCSDTICVMVTPLPSLQWTWTYTPVCENSDSVYLDTANIFVYINNSWVPVANSGGSGVFIGPNVGGNYFYPSLQGNSTVTYYYTDSNGCSASVTNSISVIFCCDTCILNAGPDITICAGQTVILNAQNCTGIPIWSMITSEGLVEIGQGETIDVFPNQSTCYVITCCDSNCCCSDTVCVIVNPAPLLQWNFSYQSECLNGDSVFLDTANIFVYINNAWIPVASSGGTGIFTGLNIIGNYFYPLLQGNNTITYYYTDSNGCSASISNTINVIQCCSLVCQADAGPDPIICQGQTAILSVQGCDSIPTWYMMAGQELIPVGQGEILDIFPHQTTCYVVVCCCPGTNCCDSDTVCVIVNPHPVLQWPYSYVDVCSNADSVYLDPANILVYINNSWIPVTQSGGSGVFSGNGVAGNYFYPGTPGAYTVYYYYTDSNGCSSFITNTLDVIFCCDTCIPDAGPDQSICAGQSAVLSVQGCTGSVTWSMIAGEETIPIGEGSIIDVAPQQTTCYVVTCCEGVCCCSDTICVTVHQNPFPQWLLSYDNICLNSGPIGFSEWDIFILVNNVLTPVPQTGGTGIFVGPNVVGNIFNPATPGLHTIYYYYTDSNGCTGFTTNTINVIDCCPECTVNAGPDITICAGQSAVLTVDGCTANATWYLLSDLESVPVGTGNSITVNPMQSTCYVVECCEGNCCCYDTVCVNVIHVLHPGPITGTWLKACLPAVTAGSSYSIPAIAGASYNWVLPPQMTILSGQGTNSIFASWTGNAANLGIIGQICVYVTGPCGNIIIICHPIDINVVKPVTPPSVSGPSKVCPGDVVTYSVATVPRSATYEWTLPPGMTIISGDSTNVITVQVGAGFAGGAISLTASNACGTSNPRTKNILLNPPLTPGPVSGPVSGQCGVEGAVYSIAPVANATGYQWSVVNGTIVNASTGLSIQVNWNSVFPTGSVSVVAINGCGTSAIRNLTVLGYPAAPGPISGSTSVCTGAVYHYSTATVTGAASYAWTAPGEIISGQGTKEIDVEYGPSPFSSQAITVNATNACGTGALRVLGSINSGYCLKSAGTVQDVDIYPNPGNGIFYISFLTENESDFRLSLEDLSGRTVLRQDQQSVSGRNIHQLPVQSIARGIYILHMKMDGVTHSFRVAIE